MDQSQKKKPKRVKRDPQEEPQISEPKEGGSIAIFKDSLVDFTEENLQKGYEVGFKGCRQFIKYGDGRRTLEYNPSAEENKKVPIWNILQKFKEQELSRVPMPVLINEPISMLQKTSEMMTNVSILETAANTQPTDSLKRLIYAAIFTLVQFDLQKTRQRKPFNPLMGETFELVQENYRYVAEQVSHHPPISAFCYQGSGFTGYGDTESKQSVKFNAGKGSIKFKQ